MITTSSDGRPRLLIVTDDAFDGGTAHLARQLAFALGPFFKVGFASSLATHPASSLESLQECGIVLHEYAASSDNISQQSHGRSAAKILLDQSDPDLVLCADSTAVSLLALKREAAAAQVPFVAIVNSVPTNVHKQIRPYLEQAQASLCAAAAIVFVCNQHRSRWKQIFPQPVDRTEVITNFCDDLFFEARNTDRRQSIRAALGVSDHHLVFMTAARITPDKGQAVSLRALRLMLDTHEGCNVRFIFAGSASLRELQRFQKQVDALGLSGHVTYLGSRSDIHDLLDASDCFVLASANEGAPLSVIEAMAKGVAVIASNVGGMTEIVEPSCGVLISSPASGGDDSCVSELAGAMSRFASDRPSLLDCSRQANLRADSYFRSAIAAEKYARLLSDVHAKRQAVTAHRSDTARDQGLSIWQSADFADPATAWSILLDGWSESEPKGVWAVGPVSTLKLSIASAEAFIRLRFLLKPFVNTLWPKQSTEVYAGNKRIGTWSANRRGFRTFDIDLDLNETGASFELKLVHHLAASPFELKMNEDERRLSFFISRTFVMPAARSFMHDLKYLALRAAAV